MRDYFFIDKYLHEIEHDVYHQPQDGDDHMIWARSIIDLWIPSMGIQNVLDVGCGVGFCQPMFEAYNVIYKGITLDSKDWTVAQERKYNVSMADYNFLPYNESKFDLVFARHALEHSVMPIISLMEWHRVSKQHLVIVNPNPDYWGWAGKNHYSVCNMTQLKFWIERAGFCVIKEQTDKYELWIHAEKIDRKNPYYDD